MSVVHSTTFTPSLACDVIVTCMYEAMNMLPGSSDWTNSRSGVSRAFVSQGGVMTFGSERYMGSVRSAQSVQAILPVLGGQLVEFGLDGVSSAFGTAGYWNIQIQAEQIFRA